MLYYGAPPDDPYGMYAVSSRVLDTNDLPCGPLNKSGNWDVQDNYISDYQPLVELPTKLKQLVPAWSSCYGNDLQGQDPPRTLSPATIMVPQPTIVDKYPQPTPATPNPPIPPLPTKTGVGVTQPPVPQATMDPKGIAHPVAGPAQAPASDDGQIIENDPGASGGSAADPKAANPKAADPNSANPPNVDPIVPQTPVPTPSLAVVVQGKTITNNRESIKIGGTTVAYQSGSIRVNDEVQQYPAAENQDIVDASPVTVGGLTFSAATPIAQDDGAPQDGTKASSNGVGSNVLPDNDPGSSTYITVGGQTIAVHANGIIVAGETLHPGGPGITIGGSLISLGFSDFVFGDHTETFPGPATATTRPSYITVNGESISVGSNSIIVDSTTLKPGDPIVTIHGKSISLGASEVVVGGVTGSLALAVAVSNTASSYTTFNGEIITFGASDIVVGGKTLKPGHPGITVNGKLVSLGSSHVFVGGVTASLALAGATASATTSYITVDGDTIDVGGGDVVVSGSTLKPGSPGITIGGKLVSLGSSAIVVGSVTEALGFPGSVATSDSSYITFAGETVAVGSGTVVVDGETLTVGGPGATVHGTVISLGSSELVIGTQTAQPSLPARPTSGVSGEGIGAMIMSGLGGMGGGVVSHSTGLNGSDNGDALVKFLGAADRRFGKVDNWFAWAVSFVVLISWA